MKPIYISTILLGGFLVACSHAVPPELASARQAYTRAARGPAAQLVPAEVHKARQALGDAENAFSRDPEGPLTRDLAYVAQRKAELSEALAGVAAENQKKIQADRDFQMKQGQYLDTARGELSRTKQELTSAERAAQEQSSQAQAERQARLDAEQKAADAQRAAQDALAKLAAVKEEQRGMVITLSGSVLFRSDDSVLLPEAQNRLNQVADALLQTKERNIIIEGHTDARGSESHNIDLSQRRAESVRQFLISKGYDADKIQARGIGKARPVADNKSAEGRANNRRVEIVVQPKDK